MPIVESSVDIAADRQDVFDVAQDYSLRLRWDPFLRELRFGEGALQAGKGVRVWVRAKNGLTMEVVYTSLDRPRSVAMKMTRGPWLFRRFAGTWRFDELPTGRTRVTFRYFFELRRLALPPLTQGITARVLDREMAQRLAGLKLAIEEGGILQELRALRRAPGA